MPVRLSQMAAWPFPPRSWNTLESTIVYTALIEEREIKLMVNEEEELQQLHVAIDDMLTRPNSYFGQYVSEHHANSNQPFKDLYQVN